MRILVIGSGGREHALCWALAKSDRVEAIYCAPGNGGISEVAEIVALGVDQFDELGQFAVDEGIDLVVVGPEAPLAAGITEHLEGLGVKVFGPSQAATQIEASKAFTKDLCRRYEIPTATYEVFDDADEALAYVREQGAPIVLKADGLAAGKGVIVAQTLEEAEEGIGQIMEDRAFGKAGAKLVIEEFLEGQELSIMAFVDGDVVRPMVAAQDHKRAFDGDEGPNTGGMGTYSPVPQIPQAQIEQAIETIIEPTAKAMVEEGTPFRGVLFAGLMMTDDGPELIEFNARFGDPETQVVLPRLTSDLADILEAAVDGRLDQVEIEWSDQAAVCVVLASGGYPISYEKGFEIEGLDQVEQLVFHAGTARDGDRLLTAGGRVLGVVGQGADIEEARARAYEGADGITFDGLHHRSDIAQKAIGES